MRLPEAIRCTGSVLLAVAVMSCTKTKKQTLLDFACGPTKLRLEATTTATFETDHYDLDLLMAGPQGWVLVDRARETWGYGPNAFSRLLAPSLAFHVIPFDARRPRAEGHPQWTVFFDPAQVSRPDYEAMSACLATNAAAIDHALGSDLPDTRYSPRNSPPHVTGTVYSRLDEGFFKCEGPTLGSRWDCEDGKTFLKTVIGDQEGQLMLCPVLAPAPAGQSPSRRWGADSVAVAKLSEDQATLLLLEPRTSPSSVSPGKDPKAYYATCRDRAGKTIFDVFRLPPAAPSTPSHKAQPPRH